jgi:RNA polymerase sigma-70 factor (ECF subfamily)
MKQKVENDQLKELIQRCAKHDRTAQEQLFKLFYGKMMGVCLRYTKDRDRAQEVVQESFIKIFDKLEEFDFKGSFEGWVRRIMVNASIDAIRKRNRQPFSTGEEYVFNDSYSVQEHNFDEDITKIKAEHAMEAIQQLSPAYQTVFNLYVIENYSHKEIAQILGISEGTSKSNLAKAKQNLRKILSEKFVKIDR